MLMKYLSIPVLSLFLGFCGGGGGRFYEPRIAVNHIELQKIELPERMDYELFEFPTYRERRDLQTINKERYGEKYAGLRHGGEIFEFKFKQKVYTLISKQKKIYLYHNEKRVKKIRIPRYMRWSAIKTVKLGGKELLVVYADQQSTSNTSTLLVLDENFDIQYQEHFMGALAFGAGSSEEYGEFFVIKCGYEKDKKISLQNKNENWLYYRGSEPGT